MASPMDANAIRTKFIFLFILSLFAKSRSGCLFRISEFNFFV